MGKSKKRNKRRRNNNGHLSACIDGYLYATVDGERLIDIASRLSLDPTVLIELNKSLNGLNMRSKFEHNALLVVPSDDDFLMPTFASVVLHWTGDKSTQTSA